MQIFKNIIAKILHKTLENLIEIFKYVLVETFNLNLFNFKYHNIVSTLNPFY